MGGKSINFNPNPRNKPQPNTSALDVFVSGETKTEASVGYVPMHPLLSQHLKDWHQQSPHAKGKDFVFPSLTAEGKVPLNACSFVKDHLRVAARASGVQIADGQRFGLHNLHHSLSNWMGW